MSWLALKVRVDCPECGSPVMLDGPWVQMKCPACTQFSSVAEMWPALLERAEEYGAAGKEFAVRYMMCTGWPTPNVFYAVNKDHPPVCGQCGEVLDEVDQIEDGADRDFHCPACGTPHPTWPARKYMGERAAQVFMAPRGPEERRGPALTPEKAVRPVMFTCPNCGGNLRIDQQTLRLLSCQYCDVDVFLPQELWLQLHPVRRRQAFWVRTR